MIPNSSSQASAWAVLQFTLRRTQLISPSCASNRNGCASDQRGSVFVEKRRWSMQNFET